MISDVVVFCLFCFVLFWFVLVWFGFQELHSVIHRHISIRHVPCVTLRKTVLWKNTWF